MADTKHDHYSNGDINRILASVKTVAIVGASGNPIRPSFFVTKYLADKGYTVFPINPGRAGGTIADCPTYATLADVPEPVDMVDIFRKPEALGGVVQQIAQMPQLPKVVWMQLGIRDDAIAQALEMMGIEVVMNRCPKIEYARLCGEICWMGFNRRTISASRPKLRPGYQHFDLSADTTFY